MKAEVFIGLRGKKQPQGASTRGVIKENGGAIAEDDGAGTVGSKVEVILVRSSDLIRRRSHGAVVFEVGRCD